MRRGEIYWANLDPTLGSEIRKTRPCLVVSNNVNNELAGTVTVLPITTSISRIYPFEVSLPSGTFGLKEPSKAKANQIRTISKERLGSQIGAVDQEVMKAVEKAILVHLEMT
ncbi:MAG: type II toxin-antitoxin system PemK/MazF family toxin [Armatimonadetes bacterium]|nr:type II toxin-antitoxin system PemK/MazF family toxin [Armatimonadota bacterium]